MSKIIKIVVVGTGFGGVYALKNLHKIFHGDKNIDITLIGEKNYFLFTPLLHEVATGGIDPGNIIEPIRKIIKCCLNNFYLGKVKFINTKEKIVEVGEKKIQYDYLILANGAETNFYDIKGARENSLTLKSLDDAMRIKKHCLLQIEKASNITDKLERKRMLNFIVVGGGPTGVELVAELQELLKETFPRYYEKKIINDISVTLIHKGKELLTQLGVKLRIKSLKVLKKKGINVMLETGVIEVFSSSVTLDDGKEIKTENVIWVAGIKPVEIKFDEEIKKTQSGQIIVNDCLQIENHPEIFAIGDIASIKPKNMDTSLPALAQVAVKESENVTENIKLLVNGKNTKPLIYHNSGNLVSLGQWMAVGEISNFSFSGHIAWWIWRTIYLSKMISFRKKLKVAMDWTINLFLPRDISKI